MKQQFLIALLAMLLCTFCKSTKMTNAPKPIEQYNGAEETPLVSTLSIPINIPIEDIVRSLNNSLSGKALYEDYSFTDNGNDGLMLNAWKSQNITLSIYGNTIKYRVPLKIWMKKELVFGTAAEAEAELALNFKTLFFINPDWSMTTQTDVEWHEWLKRPVLKTGIGDISVETIANIALNRSKKTLSEALDNYVGQQISLRPYVQSAWSAIQAPVLIDSTYQMWSKTTPTSIGISPLASYGDFLQAKIFVECINDVTFGSKPSFRPNSILPNLSLLSDVSDDFIMQFSTDVPFPEAERLAKNMMVGQVFESGKKKVKVEDILLWGNNDRIVVNTRLSGSFNGNIYFIGKPVFNPKRNAVEVKDLDFHVDTRSFLMRSASWMFSGPIKKKMASAMTFPLDENINAIKKSAQETLQNYQIQPGVLLKGSVDSVSVQDIHVTPNSLRVNLYSKGKVQVDVRGL
jgi:hypothetical protein